MVLKFPGKKFDFTYEEGKEIKERLSSEGQTFLITSDENVTLNRNMVINFSSFLDNIHKIDTMIKMEAELALQGKASNLGRMIQAYFEEYNLTYGKNGEVLGNFHLCHAGTLMDKGKQILFTDYEIHGSSEIGILVFYFNEYCRIEKIEIEF